MAPRVGKDYCWAHDPDNREAATAARKLGGARNRVPHYGDPLTIPYEPKSLEDASKILAYVLADLLPAEKSIPRARLLLAVYDSFVKSFEIGDFEKRLAALEAMLEKR